MTDFDQFLNLIETRSVRLRAETQAGQPWENLSLPDHLAKKAGAILRAPLSPSEDLQNLIEGIILRRLHEKRIEGYTMEMAKEIASMVTSQNTRPEREIDR